MTLYELTKNYGDGQGEEAMWSSMKIVSEAIEHDMPEEPKKALIRKLYGELSQGHYNEECAMHDVEQMYFIGPDGEKHHAPYWTTSQVKEVYSKYKDAIPDSYNFWDFYVALQMQKSDLYPMLVRWFPGIPADQLDKRLVEATINWLKDEDNPFGDHKVWGYVNADR